MSDALAGLQGANTAQGKTNAGDSIGKLTEDFDSFLLLLTTQLKNQDPLSPVETTEFTNQLVQFASVEQLIKQNSHLETLIDNQTIDRKIAAASYIGARVEHPTQVFDLRGGSASFSYELPPGDVDKAVVEIADASGQIVRQVTGPKKAGEHRLVWDGKNQDGERLEDGPYQMRVRATEANGDVFYADTRSFGIVTSVDSTGSEPVLTVFGKPVRLSDVSGITYAAPAAAASAAARPEAEADA